MPVGNSGHDRELWCQPEERLSTQRVEIARIERHSRGTIGKWNRLVGWRHPQGAVAGETTLIVSDQAGADAMVAQVRREATMHLVSFVPGAKVQKIQRILGLPGRQHERSLGDDTDSAESLLAVPIVYQGVGGSDLHIADLREQRLPQGKSLDRTEGIGDEGVDVVSGKPARGKRHGRGEARYVEAGGIRQ